MVTPAAAPASEVGATFFAATLSGGDVRTRGVAHATLGHRIPRAGNLDDGIFAEWHWDGDTLRITNDRYGFHPLFYQVGPDAVRVSPSIVTLLREGAPSELDHDALSVFLGFRFFLREETPFKHVRALPPGARLEWCRGVVTLAESRPRSETTDIDRDSAIDAYIDLFRAAIRRRPPPEGEGFAVPLSGGRDSRHILLELHEQGHRPTIVVTARRQPPRPDDDAHVAGLLAGAVGLCHVVLEQPDRFTAELRKNLLTSFCSAEHAWFLVLSDFLRGRVACVYDGLGGDVLSAGLFLTPARLALHEGRRYADLARDLLWRGHAPILRRLFRPELRATLATGYAVERVAAELERHAGAANPIGSFFFWNRTRRVVALSPYAILGFTRDVFSPYLDHALYDLLASLPARLLVDRRFHSDAIARGYPRYGGVPFQRSDPRRRSPRPERRRFVSALSEYVRSHASFPRTRLTTGQHDPLLTLALLADRVLSSSRWVNLGRVLYVLQLEMLAEHLHDCRTDCAWADALHAADGAPTSLR